MNSIPCDIVLLPDEALAQKAIAASQKLSEYDSFFTLEPGKVYPHLSLYMFQLNESDISKVDQALQKIASQHRTILATATEYRIGEGFAVGYIDPEYEVTSELAALQQVVIEAVNPIRAGMRQKDIAKMADARGVKLDNLKDYGYPAIGELFRPHVTLTRLKEHKPEALEVLPDIHEFSGTFTRLGLFEMGDNGTCVRQIKTIDLS